MEGIIILAVFLAFLCEHKPATKTFQNSVAKNQYTLTEQSATVK